MLKIHGEHPHPITGRVYKYRASFEGYGPDVFVKGKIRIAERRAILQVERVLHVDLATNSAVNAAHAAMKQIIDDTDFATVECD